MMKIDEVGRSNLRLLRSVAMATFLAMTAPPLFPECEPVFCSQEKTVPIFEPNTCDAQGWRINRSNIKIYPSMDLKTGVLSSVRVKIEYVLSCGNQGNFIPYDLEAGGVALYLTEQGHVKKGDLGVFPKPRMGKALQQWNLVTQLPSGLQDEMVFQTSSDMTPVQLDPSKTYALELVVRRLVEEIPTGRKRLILDWPKKP